MIHCSDGAVPGHKLVLAAISRMLYRALKDNTEEEQISILMPDFNVEQISSYFQDIYRGGNVTEHHKTITTALGYFSHVKLTPSEEFKVKDELKDKSEDLYRPDELEEDDNVDESSETEDTEEEEERKFVKRMMREDMVKVELKVEDKSDSNAISRERKDFISKHFKLDPSGHECKVCYKHFGSEKPSSSLFYHLKKDHDIVYKSPFSQPSETWKYFIKDPNDQNRRICKICQASFTRKANILASHLSTKHEITIHTQKRKKESNRTGPAWEYLEDCPSDPSKAVCKLCGKVMFRSNAVKHINVKHNIMRPQFPCSYCGKSFINSYQLKVHEGQRHTKSFKHHCDVCGKGFVERHALNTHKLTHAENGSYQCNTCGKFFKQKTGLNTHMKTHMKAKQPVPEYSEAEILAKPHFCTVCKKRFGKADYLKIHMRKHTGETPFHCTECPKQFSNSDYLKVHMRNHTGETPYQCKTCGKRFKFNSVYRKHVQRENCSTVPMF